MKHVRIFFIFITILPTVLFGQHVPSKERTDFSFRRSTDIAANLVRTSIHNYLISGRTGRLEKYIPYEWPKNTNKHYMYAIAFFLGGIATLDNGSKIEIVEASIAKGTSPEGKDWHFNPIPEYLNPNSPDIANQLDQSSWPLVWPDKLGDPLDPGWPGSWNGFFGKNQFNADQEIFYRAGDDHYDKFNYYPDSTDLTRRGMGLLIDTRILQWSQVLIQDVTFSLHFITNDGDKDLEQVGAGVRLADFVGGSGDSNDDIAYYDLREEVAWSTDSDGIGNQFFGDDPVGVVATTFLETPGNHLDLMDNDFDGEEGNPSVTEDMLIGEDPTNGIDDNGNELIDESQRNIPFENITGKGPGSAFKDYIDNDGDGESNSPVVTEIMLIGETPDNAIDDNKNGVVDEDQQDIGQGYADGIDNDDSYLVDVGIKHGEANSPLVNDEMIAQAAEDQWKRYFVPGTNIILYDVGDEDLGKAYKDGIDNDNDGAIDEGIDEGIDEMIDERRDDGIDNDEDWNPLIDDIGLDGAPNTGDKGEGDGKPTSGVGTYFPGEPNIDKTDVAESDQIGITNTQYFSAFSGTSFEHDAAAYRTFLKPGSYYTSQPYAADFDLNISSGLFELRSGATERISLAIAMGIDTDDAINNRKNSLKAYEADYQFAQAPFTPKLTAVPGDGKVTLYWDDFAEQSFDRFLSRLGLDPHDFEGYRLYRSTESAFEDPLDITDAHGVPVYKKPIAQFDRVNEWSGIHPVPTEGGAHFYLGDNSGLRHTYVDTPVTNGQRYFYVLRAYDYGVISSEAVNRGITPSESAFRLTKTAGGDFEHGPSVAIVTPNAPAAGYIAPYLVNGIEHVSGASASVIQVHIKDPAALREGQRYRITFEDTTIADPRGVVSDTLRTLNFTMARVNGAGTVGDTLIARQQDIDITELVMDGFNISFQNVEQVQTDPDHSYWNDDTEHKNIDQIHPFEFRIFAQGFDKGRKVPYDYDIVFGGPGYGQSIELMIGGIQFQATQVNFKVFNRTMQKEIQFAFLDVDKTGTTEQSAYFTRTKFYKDAIVFVEDIENEPTVSWLVTFSTAYYDENYHNPQASDVLHLTTKKPFLRDDVYEFTISRSSTNKERAQNELDRIRVVPNPYIVAASWEPLNPFRSGRGPREIHFNHLPQQCTIRIFNVMGELVRLIEHDDVAENGTAAWDLLTQDQLAVSYGIYIYHIDAPGIGSKIGRLAVIK